MKWFCCGCEKNRVRVRCLNFWSRQKWVLCRCVSRIYSGGQPSSEKTPLFRGSAFKKRGILSWKNGGGNNACVWCGGKCGKTTGTDFHMGESKGPVSLDNEAITYNAAPFKVRRVLFSFRTETSWDGHNERGSGIWLKNKCGRWGRGSGVAFGH